MSETTPSPPATSQDLFRAKDLTEQLACLWDQGQRPDVDDFLARAGDLSPAEVAAVLRFDQRERWRLGERVSTETYLLRHPSLCADAECVLDLIYNEFLAREDIGDRTCLDELLERFPQHADVLRTQIGLHAAVDAEASAAPPRPDPNRDTLDATLRRSDESLWPAVPGYEILDEVGHGGMGVIYKARQISLNRIVALKVISAGVHATAAERARFRTEAEAVARLRHPHVVQIHEVGSHHGQPYLALEFMERGNLEQSLVGKPLPPRHAAELIEVLARTIQAAHDQGIVHRDLKPANVLFALPSASADAGQAKPAGMVDILGVPKITDFGLAKQLNDDGGQTTSGAIVGTPSYMAPEQAEGQAKYVGPAVDVYALGAILYECLTGRPPFRGTTVLETLVQVRNEEPISPSRLQPNLPRDLVTICLKALAKEPGRRYATAFALADDLRRFLRDVPVTARPVTRWERGWRWCRRNPVIASLSAAIVVLVFVSVAFFGISALVRHERDFAVASQKRAEQAEGEARALQGRAEQAEQENKVRAYLARATAHRRSGHVGQRFQSLAALAEALKLDPSPELRREIRDEAAAALVLADVQTAHEWQGWPEGTVALDFDSTLKRFARLDNQGTVAVGRVTEAGEEVAARFHAPGPAPFYGLWISPDGQVVAVRHSPALKGTGDGFTVWKLDWRRADLAPTVLFTEEAAVAQFVFAFRPDSRSLAVGRVDKVVKVFDLAAREPARQLALDSIPYHLAFHPRNDTLAVASGGDVVLFDVTTGNERKRLRHGPKIKETSHLAWHPDGRRLAAACDDLKIHIWDVDAAEETVPPWTGHANLGIRMAFNHAGDRLVSIDWHRQTLLWDAACGQVSLTMPGDCGIQFSDDDALLGAQRSGTTVRLWQLAAGRELRVLRHRAPQGREIIGDPVLDSEGRVLAGMSQSGLFFCDLASGEELATVRVPQPEFTHLRCFISPGGWVMTGGGSTLLWPIQPHADQPHVVQVGPPRELASTGAAGASASPDGAVVVFANGNTVILEHRARPRRSLVLQPQPDVRNTAVSPDKRWVVTCSYHGIEPEPWVRVWNAQTGQPESDLPLHDRTWATFSPDSRWLATKTLGEDCQLWEVGTWRQVRRYLEADVAFSPDGHTLALNDVHGQIRLVEIATDREIARLTGPEPIWYNPVSFSPNGTRFIAIARDGRAIYVWDLRTIRRELNHLGLYWDLPEFLPATPPSPPLQFRLDRGYLQHFADFPDAKRAVAVSSLGLAFLPLHPELHLQRGRAYAQLDQPERAIADYSMFLTLTTPNDSRRAEILNRRSRNYVKLKDHAAELRDLLEMAPLALDRIPWPGEVAERCNKAAWKFAMGPKEQREPDKALVLAKAALKLEPNLPLYDNTLGVAYYRLGRWRDAAATLEPNVEPDAAFAAFDLYFLAMSHHHLGNAGKAKEFFDRAVRWDQDNDGRLSPEHRAELNAIRQEANTVLSGPRGQDQR